MGICETPAELSESRVLPSLRRVDNFCNATIFTIQILYRVF